VKIVRRIFALVRPPYRPDDQPARCREDRAAVICAGTAAVPPGRSTRL